MARPKCVVVREELVALTGDFKRAIVLGQLIYWSERLKDKTFYMQEEQARYANSECEGIVRHGFFYKRAEDLSEETMMGVRPKAMREYVKHLVEHNWVFERRNPKDKMDRTLHYRVNLVKIKQDLNKLGYSLARYSLNSISSKGEIEKTSGSKGLSNRPEKTSATDEKEKTKIRKIAVSKGVQAISLLTEIKKNENKKTEIKTQQYEQERVVCARIMNLFGKKLSRKKIRTLIDLAAEDVDLIQMVENTYTYHTKVEKCRSIFGALCYAIENGGWEICGPQLLTVRPVPKAVQEQLKRKSYDQTNFSNPDILEKKRLIRIKMEQLGYVFDENGNASRADA